MQLLVTTMINSIYFTEQPVSLYDLPLATHLSGGLRNEIQAFSRQLEIIRTTTAHGSAQVIYKSLRSYYLKNKMTH